MPKLLKSALRIVPAGIFFAALCLSAFAPSVRAKNPARPAAEASGLLARHYKKGERLHYFMQGTYKNRATTVTYQVHADGIVNQNPRGIFYETFDWWGLVMNGHPVNIPRSNSDFRQVLSLDPRFPASIPDLRGAYPGLVGPALDLMTFYVDLGMAIRHGGLNHPGDHFYVKFGTPNSWAAAEHLLLGEDSVDFDVQLQQLDQAAHTATLLVRHVPPAGPHVKLPAPWMRQHEGDTWNNWVQVGKNEDGTYTAAVGKETFDDVIKVSLVDGRILSATMDNPVEVLERKCSDANLSKCSDPVHYEIRRQIEIH